MSASSKASIRQFIELVWNEGQADRVDDLIAADYVGHRPAATEPIVGPDGMRRFIASCREALPDLHIQIHDQIAEEDRVAVSWTATGLRDGQDTSGLQAERRAQYRGISIVRMLAGKQVESHTEWHRNHADDRADVLAQITEGADK